MPGEEKKYYRIGEVSDLTGVEPHVLRYWEKEFPQIRPRRMARHRLYRLQDIELIKRIRRLLQEEGFTISGARKKLAGKEEETVPRYAQMEIVVPALGTSREAKLLKEIKKELLAIKRLLG